MKLFTRYNRVNLTFMAALFLVSGISYFLIINYVMVHELDEALDDYKVKINNYINTERKLPVIGLMDETRVSYHKTDSSKNPETIETVQLWNKEKKRFHKYRQLTFVRNVSTEHYSITLAKPIEGINLLIKTVVLITVLTLLAVIGSSILLNMVILRRLWRPFYDALSAMKTFKLGQQKVPEFPTTSIEEFSFMNKMAKEIFVNAQTDYRVLKEFTENASHEMQTPLAIIRSKLDLVIQEEGLSKKQISALQSIYSGIKRLTRLNQSLLLLAKIENHQFAQQSSVDVLEKVQDKLIQFQEFWQNSHITWQTNLHAFSAETNPELIDILLINLFSNAGRHNIEGGSVNVMLNSGELTIANSGSMQALDPSRLFHRFYKQAQHSQHNGLGLSIVKQICDQLGINIKYSFSENLHTFTLKWN